MTNDGQMLPINVIFEQGLELKYLKISQQVLINPVS